MSYLTFGIKKYSKKSLDTKLDHSPDRNKNKLILGIRQLTYLSIITGKTLGKLHWKSKVPFQRIGKVAIPKKQTENLSYQWRFCRISIAPGK